jgi:hypothetical protein
VPSRVRRRRPRSGGRDQPFVPRRIFLGLTEVAGYYGHLCEGFRSHGIDADVMTIHPHAFDYGGDALARPDAARALARVRRWIPVRPTSRRPWTVAKEVVARVGLLLWSLPRYDLYVFGFRNTFLDGWDLPLLRLLGKHVVCVFHGSDSRPPYIDRQNGEALDGDGMVRWVRRRTRAVRRLERWSDEVVVGGLTTQLHRRPVICFQVLGVPVPATEVDAAPRTTSGPFRVVHAPSHLATKGTPVIREAVRQLQAEGVQIDYRELVGRPNEEVLAELAEADLLVDQIYSDTLLGGLGAEAASMSCPTLIAGYELPLLELLLDGVAAVPLPPGYFCRPEEVLDVLRTVLRDRVGLQAVGVAARQFVQEQWSPHSVTERFLRVIAGDAPDDWRLDPMAQDAHFGVGVDSATAGAWIQRVLDADGPAGLGVRDKPALEQALVALAADRGQATGPAEFFGGKGRDPQPRADSPRT